MATNQFVPLPAPVVGDWLVIETPAVIFGPSFRVTRERGKVLESGIALKVMATVHPSSLLRQPDDESREREYAHFVADLRFALKASAAR